MPTKRSLNRQLEDARAQIRRLVDERTDAVETAGTDHFNVTRLAKQLDEARDENAALRRQLNDRPDATGPGRIAWARLRQELRLSQRARALLDAQVLQLGEVNERLTRAEYDRAVAAEVNR